MTDAGHLQSLAPSHGIERLPNALAGLTIVLPCFNEEDNIADAIRVRHGRGGALRDRSRDRRRRRRQHRRDRIDRGAARRRRPARAPRRPHPQPRLRRRAALGNRGGAHAVGPADRRRPAVRPLASSRTSSRSPHAPTSSSAGASCARTRSSRARRRGAPGTGSCARLSTFPSRDVDCAFKLVRARPARSGSTLASTGAMISTELLVKCRAARRAHGRARRSTTGRGSRAEQSGADPRVVARAFLRAGRRCVAACTPRRF